MRVLGLIVARGGSKGLPRKNIRMLGGHPLVAYAARSGALAESITRVIISTDDEEIADAAVKYDAEAPFMRPAELAQDDSPILATIQHALRAVEESDGPYEAVCLLQPTTPFRTPNDLDAAVALLRGSPEADSVVSVAPVIDTHPRRLRRIVNGRLMQYLSEGGDVEGQQRQDHDDDRAYRRNGALYLARRRTILEAGSLYGEHVLPYIMPEARSINIDTLQDFLLAETMLQHEEFVDEFREIRTMFA